MFMNLWPLNLKHYTSTIPMFMNLWPLNVMYVHRELGTKHVLYIHKIKLPPLSLDYACTCHCTYVPVLNCSTILCISSLLRRANCPQHSERPHKLVLWWHHFEACHGFWRTQMPFLYTMSLILANIWTRERVGVFRMDGEGKGGVYIVGWGGQREGR